MHRKIRGTPRSLESMIALGNLSTRAVTWNRGPDSAAELRKYA